MLTLLRHRRKSFRAAAAADYKSTVLADNPLFYYRLGEASGSGTDAYDEVAASNNGTYYNTPTLGQTGAISGDSNTSVKFEEANNEYAETVTLSSETSLLPCTIECFLKLDGASDSNAGIVFYRSGSNSASGLNMYGTSTGVKKLGYHWRNQSGTYGFADGPTLGDATWYYVALVVESTKATFYVIEEDGTLTTAENSVSHSALDCSNDGWYFARDSGYTNRDFQGYLDEVAIYDQALSESTLVAHAAAAGFTSSTSYVYEEDFEGSGTPSGFTNTIVGSGTIDYDYTTDPGSGSESLEVVTSGGDSYAELDLGAVYDNFELIFQNKRTGGGSNRNWIRMSDDTDYSLDDAINIGNISGWDYGFNHNYNATTRTTNGVSTTAWHWFKLRVDIPNTTITLTISASSDFSSPDVASDTSQTFGSNFGGVRYIQFGGKNVAMTTFVDSITLEDLS